MSTEWLIALLVAIVVLSLLAVRAAIFSAHWKVLNDAWKSVYKPIVKRQGVLSRMIIICDHLPSGRFPSADRLATHLNKALSYRDPRRVPHEVQVEQAIEQFRQEALKCPSLMVNPVYRELSEELDTLCSEIRDMSAIYDLWVEIWDTDLEGIFGRWYARLRGFESLPRFAPNQAS